MRVVLVFLLCLASLALCQDTGAECETPSDCDGLSGCNMRPLCIGGSCILSFIDHGEDCCMKAADCPIVDCQLASCERFTCVYPDGTCDSDDTSEWDALSSPPGALSSVHADTSDYSSLMTSDDGLEDDDDSGNYVSDGCIYENHHLVSCIEIETFDCSSTFGFKLWIPVEDSTAKMIVAADSAVSVLARDFSQCYRLPGASCSICVYFDTILMFYTQTSVTAEVVGKYAFMCDNSHNIYQVEFGAVSGVGGVCGDDGYFYLPCESETPYGISGAPSLASRDAGSAAEAPSAQVYPVVEERARSDALILDGQCVYMRAHAGETLLYCFTVTYDSCALNAYFVTVAGVQYHLPLFAIEHEGAVIGCEPTSAGDQFVCVDVTHIHRSEDELSISLATKITQDGEEKASLDMGSFTFSFPGCRQRSSQCGESEVSAAPVYMAPTTTGVVATPPGQAPVVPHVTTSSAQHSSVLWILLLGAVVIACTVTIVLAVVGTLVYLKKRRDSFSNPETAYQMMIM